jgi:hypothetical protein
MLGSSGQALPTARGAGGGIAAASAGAVVRGVATVFGVFTSAGAGLVTAVGVLGMLPDDDLSFGAALAFAATGAAAGTLGLLVANGRREPDAAAAAVAAAGAATVTAAAAVVCCRSTDARTNPSTQGQSAVVDVVGSGNGRYCSPLHRVPCNSRD